MRAFARNQPAVQASTRRSFASSINLEHHRAMYLLRSQPAEHHEHQWGVPLPRYPASRASKGVWLACSPHKPESSVSLGGVRRQARAADHQRQVYQLGVVFIGASLAPPKSSSRQHPAWFSRKVRRKHHVHQKGVALQETPKAK